MVQGTGIPDPVTGTIKGVFTSECASIKPMLTFIGRPYALKVLI